MNQWRRRDPIKDYFPLPNEVFYLGLVPGELAVYAYLLYCEDRQTYQCWPSYKTIGKAVGMCVNTVQKYVGALVDKELIRTENTSVITNDGQKRNGNLCYTILPIQLAVDRYVQRQLDVAETATARAQFEWNHQQNKQPA